MVVLVLLVGMVADISDEHLSFVLRYNRDLWQMTVQVGCQTQDVQNFKQVGKIVDLM